MKLGRCIRGPWQSLNKYSGSGMTIDYIRYIEAISKDHSFASKNKCDCIFVLRHSNAIRF